MPSDRHAPIPEEILEAASAWLARRDRGLNAAEQDDYMQWLSSDPRHAEAMAQHAAALERMMQLYEWTPAHDTEPNPDLFAPSVKNHAWWLWAAIGVAAAAAIAVAFFAWRPGADAQALASVPKSYLRVNERLALPDGSRVELKDGTQLVVQYSEKERRVKLTGGEAHFSVWKDKTRPFVVDAGGVEVRAVGTAFNVRLDTRDVKVLVTEGKVSVDPLVSSSGAQGSSGMEPSLLTTRLFVAVGEQATVALVQRGDATITSVTPDDIARELAWQAPRLEFNETPLADAVAEFNRLNRHQIEIGDSELGTRRIGGTFRPDNVDGFIRLLTEDPALEVRAEHVASDRTVLRRGR